MSEFLEAEDQPINLFVLMITMGKMDIKSKKIRGARKAPGEFVKYL